MSKSRTYLTLDDQKAVYTAAETSLTQRDAKDQHYGYLEERKAAILDKLMAEENLQQNPMRQNPIMASRLAENAKIRKENKEMADLIARRDLFQKPYSDDEIKKASAAVDVLYPVKFDEQGNNIGGDPKAQQAVIDEAIKKLHEKTVAAQKAASDFEAKLQDEQKNNPTLVASIQKLNADIQSTEERIASAKKDIDRTVAMLKDSQSKPRSAARAKREAIHTERLAKQRTQYNTLLAEKASLAKTLDDVTQQTALDRRQLLAIEAEWMEEKAKIDPQYALAPELSNRLQALHKLTNVKAQQTESKPLTPEESKRLQVLEDGAKERARKTQEVIGKFVQLQHPEQDTDPNARFHYATEVKAEYYANPHFSQLLDAVVAGKTLDSEEQKMLAQFDKLIDERTVKRILAHEFIYNANIGWSLYNNNGTGGKPNHQGIIDKIKRGDPVTPEEKAQLIKMEAGVHEASEGLLRGMDFTKDVNVRTMQQGTTFAQSQAQGSAWVGRFDVRTAKSSRPEHLGIASFADSDMLRVFSQDSIQKAVSYFKVTKDVQVLESIAAAVMDTWSSKVAVKTQGGGNQLFSPDVSALERVSGLLEKELATLRVEVQRKSEQGTWSPESMETMEKLNKQIAKLEELVDRADHILEQNQDILLSAKVAQKMSTKSSSSKIDIDVRVLTTPPTQAELESGKFFNSYVLLQQNKNGEPQWQLHRVLNDTLIPIDLNERKIDKTLPEKAVQSMQAINQSLAKINQALKGQTPDKLTAESASLHKVRQALASYREHNKEFHHAMKPVGPESKQTSKATPKVTESKQAIKAKQEAAEEAKVERGPVTFHSAPTSTGKMATLLSIPAAALELKVDVTVAPESPTGAYSPTTDKKSFESVPQSPAPDQKTPEQEQPSFSRGMSKP